MSDAEVIARIAALIPEPLDRLPLPEAVEALRDRVADAEATQRTLREMLRRTVSPLCAYRATLPDAGVAAHQLDQVLAAVLDEVMMILPRGTR